MNRMSKGESQKRLDKRARGREQDDSFNDNEGVEKHQAHEKKVFGSNPNWNLQDQLLTDS